ncbi:TetR/AcrR family transcriptional regulator [Tundrisphaera lichenicola]|uniref:TetR/AcrR family transcriptional regulator n=1 Tax=Tundrisphaera lichenicola TaxID=2029860 RepID=UPI003EB7A03D
MGSKPADATTELTALRSSGEMASHIARVAARLFADRGYDATSVREIVEAAGVTKPTLYYHFGSKRGLVEALMIKPMSGFIPTLQDLVAREPDPVRILREIFASQVAFLTEEPDRSRFLYAICFGPQNSSLQEEMHRFGEAMDGVTEGCARRLAESGLVERGRVASCAQAMRGLLMSATLDHLLLGRPLEANLADRLVVDLLEGFGVSGSSIVKERENEG